MKRLAVIGLFAAAVACREDMQDQPRYEPYEASRFFGDGRADRPEPEGTIARGDLVATATPAVDAALIARGRERYDIYCTPCHGVVGDGKGLAVLRGFPAPPSLHQQRLREAKDDYIYGVITKGYGKMYSYAASVRPHDRWAIVAYIRALQLSQNAPAAALNDEERTKLEAIE